MTSTQGTYEFMSRNLVKTLTPWSPSPRLHSPIDDLESFYYMAQWAVAFNDGTSERKHDQDEIRWFRKMISGSRRSDATHMIQSRSYRLWEQMEEIYGPFFTRSTAVLRPWFEKLATLTTDWSPVTVLAERLDDTKKEEYLAENFLAYGYRGVAEYFELIHKHRMLLERAV